MEALFKEVANSIALGLEAGAILIIAYGGVEAFYGAVLAIARRQPKRGQRKEVWLRFGVWLLLGLEFELGADIVRTAIAPTWTEIAQLAAIALIRTFLNYFLEKDLEKDEASPVAGQIRSEAVRAA